MLPYRGAVTDRRRRDPAATGDRRREPARASRRWWDADADDYQAEHGAFLGDVDFVWCPEGLREADARLLGDVRGRRVLELGCGAAAGARWLRRPGRRGGRAWTCPPGMLRHAREAAERSGVRVPLVQADALALPFAGRRRSTSSAPRSARSRSWPTPAR